MNIVKFVFNNLQENTFIVWDDTLECIIIDAGNSSEQEDARLSEFIEQHNLKPVMAVNTHGHFDHLFGINYLKEKYGVKFALSSKDDTIRASAQQTVMLFMDSTMKEVPQIDIDLDALESIRFGNTELKIIKTPGHTPGGVCLYHEPSKQLFTGDTLFRDSVGRSDLPGGDYSALMHSIIDTLLPLGDEVTFHPGHYRRSTIGHEALYNPFVVEALNGEVNY